MAVTLPTLPNDQRGWNAMTPRRAIGVVVAVLILLLVLYVVLGTVFTPQHGGVFMTPPPS